MSEKQDFKNISIVGAGAWGTALAEVMSLSLIHISEPTRPY